MHGYLRDRKGFGCPHFRAYLEPVQIHTRIVNALRGMRNHWRLRNRMQLWRLPLCLLLNVGIQRRNIFSHGNFPRKSEVPIRQSLLRTKLGLFFGSHEDEAPWDVRRCPIKFRVSFLRNWIFIKASGQRTLPDMFGEEFRVSLNQAICPIKKFIWISSKKMSSLWQEVQRRAHSEKSSGPN